MHIEVTGDMLDKRKTSYGDLSPFFRAFAAYMVAQTDRTFEEAGAPGSVATGGSYRGVTWEPLKNLKAKRPSGQYVTPMSALLQDTGRLRQLAATEITRITPTSLVMGTRLPYAVFQDARRPILFITDKDADKAQKMMDTYYEALEQNTPMNRLLNIMRREGR